MQQIQRRREPLLDLGSGPPADFQTNHTAMFAGVYRILNRAEQIRCLVLLNGHIRIARDAEDRLLGDRATAEHGARVVQDDLFQRRDVDTLLGRNIDKTRKRTRYGDDHQLLRRRRGPRGIDQKRHEQLRARQQRARIEVLYGQGCQYRQHFCREEAGQELPLSRCPLAAPNQMEIMLFEFPEHLGNSFSLLAHHVLNLATDEEQLLSRSQTAGVPPPDAGRLLLLEPRHTNHEELIEVGTDNGQELQSFAQRNVFGASLLKHAVIEFEPAQLAIDVVVR